MNLSAAAQELTKMSSENEGHAQRSNKIYSWMVVEQGTYEFNEILPYGSHLTLIDTTKTSKVLQNPQFSLQVGHNNVDIHYTILQLQQLQVSVYAISYSMLWISSFWNTPQSKLIIHFPCLLCLSIWECSLYIMIDATLCLLTGGAEILSFDQWTIQMHQYPRGQGAYISITYSGRNKKQLTIICAYIAAPKGL